jgi:hypothetical protein
MLPLAKQSKMPWFIASRKLIISVGAIWLLIFLIVGARVAKSSYVPKSPNPLDEAARIDACRTQMIGMVKPNKNLKLLAGIHGLCYAQVNEEDTLAEIGIRRSAFSNQQEQTKVIMWMVVAITMSGVVLSGVQLIAGYRLASVGKSSFEQGGQLQIENHRISLSSSVTGLMILVVSLAFFCIFVQNVYRIKDTPVAPTQSVTASYDFTYGWGDGKDYRQTQFRPGIVGPNAPQPTNSAPPNRLLAPSKQVQQQALQAARCVADSRCALLTAGVQGGSTARGTANNSSQLRLPAGKRAAGD